MIGDPNSHASEDDLKKYVKEGNLCMTSVTNAKVPWLKYEKNWGLNSHVVLITDILKGDDGLDYYFVLDPYKQNGDSIGFLRAAKDFHEEEFRGIGTRVRIN